MTSKSLVLKGMAGMLCTQFAQLEEAETRALIEADLMYAPIECTKLIIDGYNKDRRKLREHWSTTLGVEWQEIELGLCALVNPRYLPHF